MRISRLYVAMELNPGALLELDEDASHYVRTVLRVRKDAGIILFNGQGGEFSATFTEVSKKRVSMKVNEWINRSVESRLHINLGLAISRGDRMDFSVQKSVELGVNALTPILTERCVVQLKEDKQAQRLGHWRKIVQHAAEQCGRTILPQVNPVHDLNQWLDQQKGLKIFLDPHADTSLTELTPGTMQLTLLSGPEGGFADHERQMAITAGFVPVRLGARILRSETASLAALAAAQMLWGDFAITD